MNYLNKTGLIILNAAIIVEMLYHSLAIFIYEINIRIHW